ncbi:hypothetical protein RHGRI_018560 [Rhododendron griersonianum]|uniref:FBD domain-containing protein n=1 Tax=Rhododendron griersonianum TaxID=479676 RepID=A0AAV6K1V0_9ERIC|nr:hypothetical protein RHGRI_018560 [Rhododendron griersonianum]
MAENIGTNLYYSTSPVSGALDKMVLESLYSPRRADTRQLGTVWREPWFSRITEATSTKCLVVCHGISRKLRSRNLMEKNTCSLNWSGFPGNYAVSNVVALMVFRISTSVCLPSLKILNLVEVQCENEDSAENLFSGCPVLEELHMSGNSSLSLFDNQVYKLVVNAPKLEHFHLSDSVTLEFSLVNLSSLLKAKVCTLLSRSGPPTNYGPNASKLLRGIANVKFLDILIEVEGRVLPTFHNLTHLRLGLDCISCWNRDLLEDFLQFSPNLEVLVLEGESPGSAEFWSPPPQVPCCLSLHLKEVEILQFDGKEYQLELVKYLLENAKVLKKMTLGYHNSGGSRIQRANRFNLLLLFVPASFAASCVHAKDSSLSLLFLGVVGAARIPIQLPHMFFICKTLVNLRLYGNISLKVPASVWLPSLKILVIEEVIYENGDSAHNLIHGCPALEDLHLYRFYFDNQKVLNISLPTLKRLVLNRQGDDGDDDGESQHKLIVNTPKLKYLDITDYDGDEFSLENLSSLLDARIHVGPCFSGSISSSNLLKLLHGIANVKFLWFSTSNSDDYVLPTMNPLHNLTYLGLQDVVDGWNVNLLNVFLEYSPNLEVLVLEGSIAFRSVRLWSPPPRVPSCLILNLKEIEYLNFGGEKHEFEVIEYLLKSAKVLKNVTICCKHSDSWCVLARLPRASKICELNLR